MSRGFADSSEGSAFRGAWKAWLLPLFFYLALPWAIFWRLWFGLPSERQFFGWQFYHHHWPALHSALAALLAGDLPIWDPFVAGGFPLASDPSVGLYSPLALPLWIVAAWLKSPSLPLVQSLLMLQLSWLAIGFHAFFRSRGLGHSSAFLGSLVGTFAGFAPAFLATKLLGPLAWTPWLLLAIERLRYKPSFSASLFLGFVGGGAALSGSLGGVVYLVVLGGSYALFVDRDKQKPGFFRAAFVGGLVAAAWSAIVLLPWLEILPYLAPRPAQTPTVASLSTWSGLLLPFRGSTFYHGVIVLPLVTAAFLSVRPKGLLNFAGVWIGLGFLLSVLGPLARYDLASRIPTEFSYIYNRPDRFLAFVSPMLAILTAYGLDSLGSLVKSGASAPFFRLWSWIAAGLLLAALGMAITAGRFSTLSAVEEFHITQGLAILGLSLYLLRRLWPSQGGICVALLSLFFILDTATYTRNQGQVASSPQDAMTLASLAPDASGLAAPSRVFDTYATGSLGSSSIQNVRSFRFPRPEIQTKDDQELFKAIDKAPDILALYNVRTLLFAKPSHRLHHTVLLRDPKRLGASWKRSEPSPFVERYERRSSPLPRIAWFPATHNLPHEKAIFARLPKQTTTDPPLFTPEGPQFTAPFPPKTPPFVAGKLVEVSSTRLRFSLHAPHEGIALINERFFPGWKAFLQDQETPIFRASGRLMAISVPPGAHSILLVYRPWPYLLGAVLWLLVWGLFLVAALGTLWRLRRGPSLDTPEGVRA